jgi:hypothetical protein
MAIWMRWSSSRLSLLAARKPPVSGRPGTFSEGSGSKGWETGDSQTAHSFREDKIYFEIVMGLRADRDRQRFKSSLSTLKGCGDSSMPAFRRNVSKRVIAEQS